MKTIYAGNNLSIYTVGHASSAKENRDDKQ
jgi:hypothetical protein